MEKIIYAAWRKSSDTLSECNDRLLGELKDQLLPLVHGLRINIQDEIVASGNSPRYVVTDPQMDAIIQIWVDTSWSQIRGPIEDILAASLGQYQGWLVSESTPLKNSLYPSNVGERTQGFSQMVFLKRPAHLSFEEWQAAWQERHTKVAIDTQSNFEYVQNLIVRPLQSGPSPYAAIVEECFPIAALNDQQLYFDSVGDPDGLTEKYAIMMESCSHFMGEGGCDCIPTSQYDLKIPF